jgi:hypothetical protein
MGFRHQRKRISGSRSEIGPLVRISDISKKFDNPSSAFDDFREVERRLTDARPAMTALELDAAKVRVMKSAQKQPGMIARKKGSLMKSRVALVAVLALGVFMSGTGATLAVSGFANTGSASSVQYGGSNKHSHKGHHVVEGAHTSGGTNKCDEGSSGSNGNGNGEGGNGNSGKNCADSANEPAVVETEPAPTAVEAQAVEQVAVTGSSSSLPFTGFLAIPVLIVGLGLLGAGVAMRTRSRRGDHVA